ncbi:MAG: hypothetical protein ABI600_09675 [Luteolibacter sp.]
MARQALHRITSRIQLHALMLAAMIFSTLAIRINRLIIQQIPGLQASVEKLFAWLSGRLKIIRRLSAELPHDPRHICRCKRKRKSLKQNGNGFRP